jgi:hypothetical protein
MASPAPLEPTALPESVLAVLAQLDADPKLEGKGLSAAFARSFPDLPAEGSALAATEVARVAVVLGVPGIVVMDVVQLASSVASSGKGRGRGCMLMHEWWEGEEGSRRERGRVGRGVA